MKDFAKTDLCEQPESRFEFWWRRSQGSEKIPLGWWWGNNRSQEKKENGGDPRPSSPSKAIFERNERESKLELFEVDPLVNVRGLKRFVRACITFTTLG